MQRIYTRTLIKDVNQTCAIIHTLTQHPVTIMSTVYRTELDQAWVAHLWEIIYTATAKQQQLIDLMLIREPQPPNIIERVRIATYPHAD